MIPCSINNLRSAPVTFNVTNWLSNGKIVYISPTVRSPALKGALIPPPFAIATSVCPISFIASATVTPSGVSPLFLSCSKSNGKSVTFSANIGLRFSLISFTFSSTTLFTGSSPSS